MGLLQAMLRPAFKRLTAKYADPRNVELAGLLASHGRPSVLDYAGKADLGFYWPAKGLDDPQGGKEKRRRCSRYRKRGSTSKAPDLPGDSALTP
jgi:hypothetical protein